MRTEGRTVVRHIEEPDTLPFVQEQAQVLGRKNQLLCTPSGVAAIGRDEAADVRRQRGGEDERDKKSTHEELLFLQTVVNTNCDATIVASWFSVWTELVAGIEVRTTWPSEAASDFVTGWLPWDFRT